MADNNVMMMVCCITLIMLAIMLSALQTLNIFCLVLRHSQQTLIAQLHMLRDINQSGNEPRTKRFKSHPERPRTKKFADLWSGEEARFIRAYRLDKNTFSYVLDAIRDRLTKVDVVGDTIPPEVRLAVCLSRLGRGEYFYNIAEDYGIGEATACTIHNETTRVLVELLYQRHVTDHLPQTREEMATLQRAMAFPYAYGAIDGCHIRLKCPNGGGIARKCYYNFKNFYSIILLALVDGSGRFLWASAGMPGNCHDSTLLQSTQIWPRLRQMSLLGDDDVPAYILGDNAFPFRPYLMKRFANARRTDAQKTWNRKLSSSRVIVENTFGMLKTRFRELFRGSEANPDNLKYSVLAAVLLHNIMLERNIPVLQEDHDDDNVVMLPVLPEVHHEDDNNNGGAERIRQRVLPLVL